MTSQRYTLDQIANCLERACLRFERAGATSEADSWRRVQNYLHHELERPVDPHAICERLLVGQGGDTYDPLCSLPKGHEGPCKPSDYYMP